jgi:hypothetical protein
MPRRPPSPTEPEIIESAIRAIEGALALPILDRHKRDIINGMLWKITEAGGKYRTRFRSRASLDDPSAKPIHEHVFTRKHLTDEIMANPSRAREVLASAIGCVVTAEEHRRLAEAERKDPALRGWDRYKAAGIEVVDQSDS